MPDQACFMAAYGPLVHRHQNHSIGPSISLALDSEALETHFFWLSTELIHWAFGPHTVLSHNIVILPAVGDSM